MERRQIEVMTRLEVELVNFVGAIEDEIVRSIREERRVGHERHKGERKGPFKPARVNRVGLVADGGAEAELEEEVARRVDVGRNRRYFDELAKARRRGFAEREGGKVARTRLA